MVNENTKEVIIVECNATDSVVDNGKSLIDKTLYVKEYFNISDVAYHELAQLNPALPRQSALAKVSKNLNAKCQIQPTPGQTVGVQQSIMERLRIRLRHILKNNPSFALRKSIHVKITGDRTVVSRSLHLLVIIVFSLLHEGENPNSPNGNHTITLLQTIENYDNISEALVKIVEDIKTMKSITVDDISFSVEFFLGADWKFLALVIGIESALSTYFCIWCKCAAEFRHILGTLSMEDPQKGAWTIDEIQKLAESKKKPTEKYGCVR